MGSLRSIRKKESANFQNNNISIPQREIEDFEWHSYRQRMDVLDGKEELLLLGLLDNDHLIEILSVGLVILIVLGALIFSWSYTILGIMVGLFGVLVFLYFLCHAIKNKRVFNKQLEDIRDEKWKLITNNPPRNISINVP
jgi:hypothetical protein